MVDTENRPPSDGNSNMQLLGEVMWLMAHSPIHRSWPIESLMQWVTPALLHRQCRVYRRQGKPIAYVSWAYLSKEVEEAYVLNPSGLQPKDWKSGDRIWLLDVLAPFGGSRAIARDLKNGIFKDSVGRALRVKPGQDEMRIVYLHGANAIEQSRDRTQSTTVDLVGAIKKRIVKPNPIK